jgi:hypothetical protein
VDTLTTMSTLSEKRPQLWQRCQGLCEVSGQPIQYDEFDMHHRRRKGMGGTSRPDRDSIENLLAVHSDVHHIAVHGQPRYPVWLRGQCWVLLGADGNYWPLPNPTPPPPKPQKR